MNKEEIVSKIVAVTKLDQNTVSTVVDALEKIVEDHLGNADGIQGALGKMSGVMNLFKKQ